MACVGAVQASGGSGSLGNGSWAGKARA
jgi:hypothetical protein